MTDQLIEKLEAEIEQRKTDVDLINKQIERVFPEYAKTVSTPNFEQQVVDLSTFKIYDTLFPDGRYVKGITQFNGYVVFQYNADGTIKMSSTDWFKSFGESVDTFLMELETQKNQSKLNDLIATARSLGIDTTPYEADGVGSEGNDGNAKAEVATSTGSMKRNGVDQI